MVSKAKVITLKLVFNLSLMQLFLNVKRMRPFSYYVTFQVSILSTFYQKNFCTKVFRAAFLQLQFCFVIFWCKNICAKAALKMLLKLTIRREGHLSFEIFAVLTFNVVKILDVKAMFERNFRLQETLFNSYNTGRSLKYLKTVAFEYPKCHWGVIIAKFYGISLLIDLNCNKKCSVNCFYIIQK